jgi:hypothetical protein
MNADLSGYNKPKPKKGGKNKRCNDGDGDSRPANPGSVFFNTVFEEVIPQMAKFIAHKNSENSGVIQNENKPGAHNILYMHGGGDENGMKEINAGLMTMSNAFKKDNRILPPEKLPGPNMEEAKDAYYNFLQEKYPTVWGSFNREHWDTQEKRARDDMMVAYTIWNAKHEDKHGGVDGGVDGGAAGGAAKARKKRAKKSSSQAGGKNAESVSSPKEQGTESDEDPVQVMGIVGLPDAAGGSADPIQAEVVASFEPGDKLPPGIPMTNAVGNDQVPVSVNLEQEKGKHVKVNKVNGDDVNLKQEKGKHVKVNKVNGDDVIVKTDPDAAGAASSQDKNAIRAAKREAAKLLPSSGLVDLTGDD